MEHRKRSSAARLAYRYVAIASTGLGAVGLVLPLVPTTPFLLLALWAANRSSPRLSRKIRRNRHFAPVIEAWENGRAIPTRAKVIGVVLMGLSWTNLWWFGAPTWLLTGIGLMFLIGATFILSRPSPQSVLRRTASESD
ncbi:MAG: YbaN family protein [Pseudomonadota bacterium]